MIERIKKWWAGEWRDTPMALVMSGAPYENILRPWPYRAGRALWRFYLLHWKFLWASGISITAIVVGAIFTGKYNG